jgi:hypothetical protein
MNTSIQVLLVLMWITGYVLSPFILIWGWTRWARQPKQRSITSILSLLGFALASASALLGVSSIVYADLIHGFRYYDPRLLRIFRIGFLLSASGLVAALIGVLRQNSLRWHAPVSAIATLAFWTAAAAGE